MFSLTSTLFWLYAFEIMTSRIDSVNQQAILDMEMEQHCRDQRVTLASRLRKRKAAKEEALRRAGAGEEEIVAAMQALDFEGER